MDFDAFFAPYEKTLWARACRCTLTREDASDVLQNVRIKAWRSDWQSKAWPLSWLKRLTGWEAADVYRERAEIIEHEPRYAELDDLRLVSGGQFEHAQDQVVKERVRILLPGMVWEVFNLIVFEDLSERETAARLNIGRGAVRERMKSAKQILRNSS